MRNLFHRIFGDQSGVTAIEYGLIPALIAVVITIARSARASTTHSIPSPPL
jgi:Flp pilus assembly pilin Flp